MLVTLLNVVVVLHTPIDPLTFHWGWSWYRDTNLVPTSLLASDLCANEAELNEHCLL